MIKALKHECLKQGNRIHKFTAWVRRKFGTLVIQRDTSYGNGTSLPCVLCRKVIEKHGLRWRAYDGDRWIDSLYSSHIPKSKPTNKQRRLLRFGFNDESEC